MPLTAEQEKALKPLLLKGTLATDASLEPFRFVCASAQRHRRYFLLNNKAVNRRGPGLCVYVNRRR